ncbi:MAG: transporter substrate-binding domain-containing protein [Fervidobacterium sp.]|nr:transporter substrate-binding domain-containing protein [Fervidobacterium sp.]
MRKLMILIIVVVLMSQFFSQFLKVGFLLGLPYAFWKAQSFGGIDYDILKKVAQVMGYQLEVYVLPFSALAPDILNKLGLDIVAGGIHMTDERQKLYTFSVPYAESGLAIVLKKGLQWNGNVEKIVFGVKQGATGERIVKDWINSGKNVKYTSFVSNEEIIANLMTKKIDAAFFDYINALYLSRNYGFTVYKELVYKINVGYIILNKDLSTKINETIRNLKNNYINQVIVSYVGNIR